MMNDNSRASPTRACASLALYLAGELDVVIGLGDIEPMRGDSPASTPSTTAQGCELASRSPPAGLGVVLVEAWCTCAGPGSTARLVSCMARSLRRFRAPQRRASGRNDRDRIHLDEEVGMSEALDDGGRDDRRICWVAPDSLECRVPRSEVLAVNDEDIPLHDVIWPGTGGLERSAQVAQDLLGLRGDIADADDVPLGVDRVLAPDIERPDAARDHRHVAERRVPVQATGVEKVHASAHRCRGSRRHLSLSFPRRLWAAIFARLPQRSIEHQRRCPDRDVATNRSAHRHPSPRLSRAARGPPRRSMASRATDDMRLRTP